MNSQSSPFLQQAKNQQRHTAAAGSKMAEGGSQSQTAPERKFSMGKENSQHFSVSQWESSNCFERSSSSQVAKDPQFKAQVLQALPQEVRQPLLDITNMAKNFSSSKHESSLGCLLKCAEWVLEIQDMTDEQQPFTLATLINPRIFSKHCTPLDQADPLEDFYREESCASRHNSGTLDIPNLALFQYLSKIGVNYPIRNRAKTINTNLVNFEMESDYALQQQMASGTGSFPQKEEVFMMEFDLYEMLGPEIASQLLSLDNESYSRSIMFKINGTCHQTGEKIFTDDLHYILKGSKLLRCCIDQVNAYRERVLSQVPQMMLGQYLQKNQYLIKVTGLPKSFGFLLSTSFNTMHDNQIHQKMMVGRAHMSKLYFNFNINSFILNENKQYYQCLSSVVAHPAGSSHVNSFSKSVAIKPFYPPEAQHEEIVQFGNPGQSFPETISLESLVDNLSSILRTQVPLPQLPFESNLTRFYKAIQIQPPSPAVLSHKLSCPELDEKDAQLTLGDLFESLADTACFGLKVGYSNRGEKVRVDYIMTLSCFNIIRKSKEVVTPQGEANQGAPDYSVGDSLRSGFKIKIDSEQRACLQATTVSQKRPNKTHFTFAEDQPPHLRLCLPEQVQELSDSGNLDLSIPLSELSPDSFFALHYSFLKHFTLGGCSGAQLNPTSPLQGSASSLFNTSFLVYYQFVPELDRVSFVGLLPFRIDQDNTAFWLGQQDSAPAGGEASQPDPYQFKKQELENLTFCRRLIHDLEVFVAGAAGREASHPDFEYMISRQ